MQLKRIQKEDEVETKEEYFCCPEPFVFLLSLLSGKWASGRAKLPSFFSSLVFFFFSWLWQRRAGRHVQSSRTLCSDVRLLILARASQGSSQYFSAFLVNFVSGVNEIEIKLMDKDVNLKEKIKCAWKKGPRTDKKQKNKTFFFAVGLGSAF